MPRLLFLGVFLLISWQSSAQQVVVRMINVTGNQLTKEYVILRELPFAFGDTIDAANLSKLQGQAVKNLNNTTLFNFNDVNYSLDGVYVDWSIEVVERWYIWPGIVFSLAETNFNSWWQNKDFERLNYGFYVQHMNVRGRREKLTLHLQGGWKRKIGLTYQMPGINKKRTVGAGLELYYANNREINYGSLMNERRFFKNQTFIQEEIVAKGKLEFRPRIYNRHRFAFGVKTIIIHDTVKTITRAYLPGTHLRSQALMVDYGFRRERRDNVSYPLKGYLLDGTIEQVGFGILSDDDVQLTQLMITTNFHHHLGGRWYFGHGLKGKSTLLGHPSYYYQRGLGYGSAFIRGYELVVIDGQHYGLYKSNIKYQLVKKRTTDLKLSTFKNFDKFHYSVFLNVFGDAGYVIDDLTLATNPLANDFQYAAGLGLDFVTYYDIVIRFEGSINKQGIPAFYVHFKNPI